GDVGSPPLAPRNDTPLGEQLECSIGGVGADSQHSLGFRLSQIGVPRPQPALANIGLNPMGKIDNGGSFHWRVSVKITLVDKILTVKDKSWKIRAEAGRPAHPRRAARTLRPPRA